MASKEIYKTIKKLWLLNYGIVIVIIMIHSSCALDEEAKEVTLQNATSIENNSTDLPVAEPLIRYRRQPPRTIVKHFIRPKRYKMKRIKRPKIKYSFAEPPATYYSRKPVILKKPIFDSSLFEDFSHMNVESADFDLPPSSYDKQSMDLDFYKHYEPSIQAASYKEIHKPSLYSYAEPDVAYKETLYTEVTKPPTYTYTVPEITFKETSKPSVTYSYTSPKTRKPHTKYGLPTELTYSTGYDKPSGNKYAFEAPASEPVYIEIEKPYHNVHIKNEHSYQRPSRDKPRIPATSYGVPDVHLPATASKDYNKYSLVEQSPPYASETPTKTKTYNFAEPPQPEPSVEITYSPSYEINIPSRHENRAPAQHAPPKKYPRNSYEDDNYQEHPTYDKTPAANTYDSPPLENYEGNSPAHQEVSGTNQPANYQPAPPRQQSVSEYIPPSEELPINVNHQHPSYDYPKSSYEVPIYDPIPFDASNQQEREIYPPQTFDPKANRHPPPPQPPNANNHPSQDIPSAVEALDAPSDTHSPDTAQQSNVKSPQSPINHLRRTRKRKRTKADSSTVSTTKHILDVPELEEAFEKENRNTFANSHEPDAHASQRFEKVNNQNNINDNYSKGPWNPMKIRTSPTMQMKTKAASTNSPTTAKNKRHHYKQQRKTPSSSIKTTTENPRNAEIISIEKSKSKSFYDDIVSTNFFRNRFRLDSVNTSTTSPSHIKSANENGFSKRTTKNVFDTTLFKSPITDRDLYRDLPKNHKL